MMFALEFCCFPCFTSVVFDDDDDYGGAYYNMTMIVSLSFLE